MPTAAKLAASVLFALVAALGAQAVKPQFSPGTQFGNFVWICAGIGVLVGWRVMGPRVGRGLATAAGSGIATSFVVVFWCLFVFATNEMVQRSIKGRYDGPFDAVIKGFGIAAEYAVILVHPTVLGIVLIGGMASGMAVEWVSRRWR